MSRPGQRRLLRSLAPSPVGAKFFQDLLELKQRSGTLTLQWSEEGPATFFKGREVLGRGPTLLEALAAALDG